MWIAPLFILEEKEKSVKEGMEMAVIWFCWPCFNAVFSDTEYNSKQAWGSISTGPCEHCFCHPRQVRFSKWVWSQRAAQKLVRGGIQLLSGFSCAADCWTWVFAVIQYCKILLSSIFPLYSFKIIWCISGSTASPNLYHEFCRANLCLFLLTFWCYSILLLLSSYPPFVLRQLYLTWLGQSIGLSPDLKIRKSLISVLLWSAVQGVSLCLCLQEAFANSQESSLLSALCCS